jgi:membrane protein YqaA with SNARE-associated domain
MRAVLHDLAVTLKTLGPTGLFLLSVLDSIGVPLPAFVDAVVVGAGVASAKDPYYAWLLASMAVLGSTAGNAVLFLGAQRGSRMWNRSEPDVPPGRRQKMSEWFQQYGLMTVFIPAVVPVLPLPLKVFVIIAGVMHTPFWKFMGVILVSRLVRYFGLAWLGLQLGADAEGFLHRNAWSLTAGAVAMAGGLYWLMGRKATPPAA